MHKAEKVFHESTHVAVAWFWNMRFKLHHELVISLSPSRRDEEKQRAARAENHINFISSCRIVITILSIFMLFMGTWIAFLWSIQLTWSTGCNLKCIFMHTTFFCFLLSRSPLQWEFAEKCIHVRRNFYFFLQMRDADTKGGEEDLQLNLCSVNSFIQNGFYCYL